MEHTAGGKQKRSYTWDQRRGEGRERERESECRDVIFRARRGNNSCTRAAMERGSARLLRWWHIKRNINDTPWMLHCCKKKKTMIVLKRGPSLRWRFLLTDPTQRHYLFSPVYIHHRKQRPTAARCPGRQGSNNHDFYPVSPSPGVHQIEEFFTFINVGYRAVPRREPERLPFSFSTMTKTRAFRCRPPRFLVRAINSAGARTFLL